MTSSWSFLEFSLLRAGGVCSSLAVTGGPRQLTGCGDRSHSPGQPETPWPEEAWACSHSAPRGQSTCLAFPSSCPYCPPLSFPLRLNRSHRKSIFLSPPRAATRQGTAGPGTALTRRLELLTQVLTRVGVTCHRLLVFQLVEALVWVSGHLAPRWQPSQVGEDMP